MKILQMLPSLELGGVERGVIDLARGMKAAGHQAPVMSSGGSLVAELEKMGVPHFELPVHKKSLSSLALVSEIADIVRNNHIDAIHARSRVPAWLGWLAARKAGVPFMTTCHGYYSTHMMSRVMGWGKPIIVPSKIIGRHMVDDFGVDPDVIRLVPRGVDLDQFQFSDKRFKNPEKPFRIIHVGRLSPIKGQVEFLKAIHLLRSRMSSVEVWMVGSEGKGKTKYTEKIKDTIQQYGLGSCVKMLGTARNVSELISESDVLVMSTLVPEAFGRVIVEAGAVGTPVVSTEVGGVVDIIDDGVNGSLVPLNDLQAMSDAILDLLTDREKAQRYALNLRKKVEEKFTLKHMVDHTIRVYGELQEKKKILFIKLGAMGDLILSVPSMRMLKKRYPHSSLTVIVDKRLASLISNVPYVDELFLVDRKRLSQPVYLLKTAKRLRKEHFDISIDLQNSKWTHLLAYLGGAKKRYGYSRGKAGFLLNRPDKNFSATLPPVKHQFQILAKAGVTNFEDDLELFPKEESVERVRNWLKSSEADMKRTVGFVLGSSPNWESKRWPVERFMELAALIRRNYDARFVIMGAEDEKMLAQIFTEGFKGEVINLCGKTELDDLVPLLAGCDLLVTGDTAPLHVASAVNTPVIGLFGPTNPKRHMPPGKQTVTFSKNLKCQPCYSGTCLEKDKLACLKQISASEVFHACQKFLKAGVSSA